jgi:hypothetical protein
VFGVVDDQQQFASGERFAQAVDPRNAGQTRRIPEPLAVPGATLRLGRSSTD